MGTDIHGFIEVRNSHIDASEPDDELFLRWHRAMDLCHVYDGRSYEAFGCLFGVRNASFEPLAAQRGFPPDASRAVARAFEWEDGDAHSASWISWAELTAADWDEQELPNTVRSRPEDRLTRRQVLRDEDWGDVWTVMRALAKRHGAENVRLVVWFDN
ncbi:hypothetical protein [Streptomyces sp. 142MFCol3.1]|uniref:hypothetical protein n=1 Tax=Streptomyces sp. 142MFCol3.1 TaxID=1172179 RepID=UPI0003FA0019|nr:hypothetical protein [Streptomyces sp. 142MFCol3.1]